MPQRSRTALIALGVAVASAVLGALQTYYGVDLGLCPEPAPVVESTDGGTP
jgi:hypothetical protein